MSSRQLRKLQKQRELEMAMDFTAPKEESEEEEEVVPVAKPRVSLFAALGGDDEAEEDEEMVDSEPEPVKQEIQDTPVNTSKSNKKKKKKKKKKAKTVKTEVIDQDDEIDKAIKALNLNPLPSKPKDADDDASPQHAASLFSINTHHLKALNEMRSLFGRDIISSAAAEEEEADRARHRRGLPREVDLETFLRGPPGQKKLSEVSLRRNIFIQGREHWPAGTSHGLIMKEVQRAEDGSWAEYTFAYDTQYDELQYDFFGCVQVNNSQGMINLLQNYPYHVSTLLQVSSMAKQDQNMAFAAELCERALFSFGRVTTSAFRQALEQGRARLDFRRPENRQFWLAGYHYLKSLIRKGTSRTALEWAKLLYSLDPRDPYAMRHFIPFLALRAHESQWLVDFLDQVENRDAAYLRQSAVLAKLQLDDARGARADLEAGMRQLPWLYCALFQELNLDTPPSIWGIGADSDARQFSVKLYIYQNKDVWNNPQAVGLLQDVARAIEKVDTSRLPSDDPRTGLGSTRLAYLESQTSLLAVAPREFLERQPNYEFDPLPPRQEDNIFSSNSTYMAWQEAPGLLPLPRSVREEAAQFWPDWDLANLNQMRTDLAHVDPAEIQAVFDGPTERTPQGLANALRALIMRVRGQQADEPQTGGEDAESEPDLGVVPGSWPNDDTGSETDGDDGHARNGQH